MVGSAITVNNTTRNF